VWRKPRPHQQTICQYKSPTNQKGVFAYANRKRNLQSLPKLQTPTMQSQSNHNLEELATDQSWSGTGYTDSVPSPCPDLWATNFQSTSELHKQCTANNCQPHGDSIHCCIVDSASSGCLHSTGNTAIEPLAVHHSGSGGTVPLQSGPDCSYLHRCIDARLMCRYIGGWKRY
jgi:hypothetical protein